VQLTQGLALRKSEGRCCSERVAVVEGAGVYKEGARGCSGCRGEGSGLLFWTGTEGAGRYDFLRLHADE
jgi:hypothetical protein